MLHLPAEKTRPDVGNGQHGSGKGGRIEQESEREDGPDGVSHDARTAAEHLFPPNRARCIQGHVAGQHVIGAAFCQGHENQGSKVKKREQSKSGMAQEPPESRERDGQPEGAEFELAGPVALGATLTDVASVDGAFHLDGDETVACFPEQMGRGDDECQCGAEPEPGAAQMMALGGKDREASDEAHHGKGNRIFGENAETDRCSHCEPPAFIAGPQQHCDEKRHQGPRQVVEGDVLHERAKHQRDRQSGEEGDGLRRATAAEKPGDQGDGNERSRVGDGCRKTKGCG